MTITVNSLPFDIFSSEKDAVILRDFTGEAPDDAQLSFKRVLPKPTKDFVGMEKGEVKLTIKDSAGKLAGIYLLSTSVRADQLEATKAANLATLLAAGAHASTQNLVKQQQLPYSGS